MKILGFTLFEKTHAPLVEARAPLSRTDVSAFARNDNSSGLNTHMEYRNGKWVNFGDTNRFPNYLNDLVNSSGLHSAIIDFKKNLIAGGGIKLEGFDELDTRKQVEVLQFKSHVNANQTLEDLVQEVTLDYLVHGTVYLKVHWNSDHTKILKIYRIEPSRIRVGINKEDPAHPKSYFYCVDWDRYGEWGITEYPAWGSKKETEIYRFIIPNSAVVFNTLPPYAAATNWIQLDGEVSTYHKSNIENSINPSVTVKFYKQPANDEEKRKIVSNIKKAYSGSANTGKAMIFFSDDKETAPDVDPVAVSNIDKQFSVTADAIQRNICYSHSINPSLMGLKTPGSLGNSAELETAYEIFKQVVINPAKRDIEQILNKMISTNGLKVKLQLIDPEIKYRHMTE